MLCLETESPNDFFSFLLTRVPEHLWPLIEVMYDYGCGLSKYSFIRYFKWFKWVIYFVDEFHFKGHVCSIGHSIKPFRKYCDQRK